MSTTAAAKPIVGAALTRPSLEKNRAWVIDAQRDLELQDFCPAVVLNGDWRPLAERIKRLLDGYCGRLGVHGPYAGLSIASSDPDIRAIVTRKLDRGLDVCAFLGATQMVIHSPFTTWDHFNMPGRPGSRERLVRRARETLAPIMARATDMGCELVIENIEDNDAHARVELVRALASPAVRVSLDTGHANYARGRTGGPPIDHHIHAAGDLLAHVHLQDTDGYADRHWHPGEGTIAWAAVFAALGTLKHRPRLLLEVDDEAGVQAGWRHLVALGLVT